MNINIMIIPENKTSPYYFMNICHPIIRRLCIIFGVIKLYRQTLVYNIPLCCKILILPQEGGNEIAHIENLALASDCQVKET
jgi:hypothetical protein